MPVAGYIPKWIRRKGEALVEKGKEFANAAADFAGVSDFVAPANLKRLPARVSDFPVEAAGAVTEAVAPQMRRPLRDAVDDLTRDLDRLDKHLKAA